MSEPVEPGDEDVRRLLRQLPEVSPPDGFFDDLIRQRHRRAHVVALAGLAAAVAAGAFVVGQATGITGDVTPSVAELAERHDVMMDDDTTEIRTMTEVPAPYQAPQRVGSMSLGMAVRHPDDVLQVVYGDDGDYVSVFEEVGDLDDGALDTELTPLRVAGVRAWRTDDGVIVVRRSDVVYVLVGDIDEDELADVVADLPDARPLGLTDRIGDAMDDLVDAFGLVGG